MASQLIEVLFRNGWRRRACFGLPRRRRAENIEPRAGFDGANLAKPMAGMSM